MAAVILVIYPGLGTGLDGGWGGKIGRAWWEEQWGQFGQCSGCSRSVQHRSSSVMVPSPPPPPASLPPGHGHDPSAGDRSARRAVPASEGLGALTTVTPRYLIHQVGVEEDCKIKQPLLTAACEDL